MLYIDPSVSDEVDSRVVHSSTSDSYIGIRHRIQERVVLGQSSSDTGKENDYGGEGQHEQNQHDGCSF